MGKYRSGVKRAEPQREERAIWRGIGCLLIVLVPIVSYAAAYLSLPFFVRLKWIPKELLEAPETPAWLQFSPVLVNAFESVFGQYGSAATIGLTVVLILVIGGILTILYSYMYQLAAPSRYGPMDVPAPRGIKIKKYKR